MAAPVIRSRCACCGVLALGGEYGGAATYVAEHAPMNRRGYYTSWIQTTATMGLLLSLVIILLVQSYVNGNYDPVPQFSNGARRFWVPDGATGHDGAFQGPGAGAFRFGSIFLLGISLYIRLQMEESPPSSTGMKRAPSPRRC